MSDIWVAEAGPADGDLIVLIHGSMDRSSGMLKVSRRLDTTHRVLRYDRRGYGRSSPHPGPFDMETQVDDLMQLLGGRSAVLIGHSYGGNVALAAAQRHPELVRGVCVYETPLSWEPWWPGTTAGAQAIATAGQPDVAAERFMRRLIGDARWEGLPEATRAARRQEGSAMVGELTDLRTHAPWTPGRIGVAVFAGYGSGGAAHHRRGMEQVATDVSGATLVVLPGCRHDAPLSQPDLFCDLIVRPLLDAI